MPQILRRMLVDSSDNNIGGVQLPDGSYGINVASQEIANFNYKLARGDFSDIQNKFVYGKSAAITTSESVIWDNGGNYTFLTAAEKLAIVSASDEDKAGGAGAYTLFIEGLDANFVYQNETISLNGTTEVNSTKNYIRLLHAEVRLCGTNSAIGGANTGIITISGDTSDTVLGKILATRGQIQSAIYTVPAGKSMYIMSMHFSTGEGKACTYRVMVRNGVGSSYAFSVKYSVSVFENTSPVGIPVPLKIPEKLDICITGITTAGTVDGTAGGEFFLADN